LFAVNEERVAAFGICEIASQYCKRGAFGGTWTRGEVFDITKEGRRWQCICWWAYRLVRKGVGATR
jgi:hypothetical protein